MIEMSETDLLRLEINHRRCLVIATSDLLEKFLFDLHVAEEARAWWDRFIAYCHSGE